MNDYAGIQTVRECEGLIKVYTRGLTKVYTHDKREALEAKISALRARIEEIEHEQDERQAKLF